ncbi:ferric reductase-like transmembrane domain-containing protein [Streptomyces cyslabdanicus]|uniref:ferric reductase-like transmembrane domain-containing protein n=1 Tax=Streptomyces cyslabdanicus TaxID=1470456 RepID=UPI004043DBD1
MGTQVPSVGRGRNAAAVGTVLALVLTVTVGCCLTAPGAWAAEPPIPGSPLDAYNHHVPYDVGVHKIARLAAIIAYVLMVATVVLGVMLRLRFMQQAVNRSTFYGAHMTLALSATIFGGMHGLTFLYQPIWQIGWTQLTVPFVGGVQRLPVGFGILGTELAIAVACSLWLQRRLGYHRWLKFHQLAYVAFALLWLHIFLVHPEPRHLNPVSVGIAAGAGTVLLALLIRIFPSRSRLRQHAFPSSAGGIK